MFSRLNTICRTATFKKKDIAYFFYMKNKNPKKIMSHCDIGAKPLLTRIIIDFIGATLTATRCDKSATFKNV